MNFDKIIKLYPKKFTEECVLISVYFTLSRVKGFWFLNYINAPGGSWQELKILKKQIEQRYYIGKKEKRVDLIMQKENNTTLFYLAEAKEFFRQILSERRKIDKSLLDVFVRIKKLYGGNIKPVYSYIIGIDTTGLENELIKDIVDGELNCIRKIINKLPSIDGGRLCIVSYWNKNKTEFRLVFSKDFSQKLENMFKKIFL
ncbi:MAG: hypothetical protein ABIJ17_01525 [Patescibacteria group bacterium]